MTQVYILIGTFFLGVTVATLIIFSWAIRKSSDELMLELILSSVIVLIPAAVTLTAFIMAVANSF